MADKDITKIKLLYELGHITKDDARIPLIQRILENKNLIQRDNWIHDIIVGDKTLDDAISINNMRKE